MRGYHAEEISTLNDEELNNLINALKQEKIDRDQKKKEELMDAFSKAWRDVEEAGFAIHVKDADSFYDGDDIYFEEIEIY